MLVAALFVCVLWELGGGRGGGGGGGGWSVGERGWKGGGVGRGGGVNKQYIDSKTNSGASTARSHTVYSNTV